jgi:ABC-type sulfate transport system substrate-binding protein
MNKSILQKSNKNWSHPLIWLLGVILLGTFIYLGWNRIYSTDDRQLRLVVYAFSTQEEVLRQGIFPAFERAWEAETGKDLILEGVFGPSGTLSVQITQGAPADVAIFSNQRHIDWLKFSKVVDKDTDQVMIASTPLVILTRPENPAGISDFADLMQPGIQLLHGDPIGSGVGEWAVLAEYGSAYLETGDHNIAESQLQSIWQNVRLLGSSARVTMTLFELGAGDALISYEQDARFAQERGIPLEVIMPQRTILARHYAVIIDKNVTSVERPVVEAFLAFILSDEGQQILSQYYFRPATLESDLLPALLHPFTEEDLGGWAQAYDRLIEDYWKSKIEPGLEMIPIATFRVTGER